jgi:hypothetical protein
VLIYFGYPLAHEDDAERAVRAGLALIEAVGKLRIQEPLQARIGIATGLVVVGDIVGAGEAQERGVVGETPNVAARLEGIAAPDTVVIAEGTGRLATSSNLRISGPRTSRASPSRYEPGRRCGRGLWRAVLRCSTRPARLPSWGGRKRPNCCRGAGPGQRPAKARLCCSPARPGSASRGSHSRPTGTRRW